MSQVILKKCWGDLFTFLLEEMGGDQFIFPWGAVKVPTMIQKGAVQTTFCF